MTDTDLPTVIHCVAAAIAAVLIALPILLFTVRIKVGIEANENFSLWVSFLGIRHTFFPKKKKKYKLSDYTPEKIAKRDKAAAEAAKAKAEAKAKQRAARSARKKKKKAADKKLTFKQKKERFFEELEKWPHIDDSANLLIDVLDKFFTTFLGKFHFHVARIRIAVGSENAARTALLTTAIDSSIDPLLFLINKHSNLHVSRNADICVYPDYLSEKIRFDVKLAFSMSLGSFIVTLIKTFITGYTGWNSIRPEPKAGEKNPTAHKGATSVKAQSQPSPQKK